ncbi:MAG: hypothetical protein A2Y77_13805 [Planctomycetes bacterium RBG_13_62_9]|nr:MAG: hypothetical protein A2Y77_13805 [Planctomycetes bacterium RBG_13_62_9]
MTLIEILVVVSVIAILVGILIPALNKVQNTARDVKQKGQFTAIDLGLAAFRSDYGDYPPSFWWDPGSPSLPQDYCGAQKLAEALLGWDLLGFHPDSAWRGDGLDAARGPDTYDPLQVYPAAVRQDNLKKRRDRYIELDVANPFRLRESAVGLRDGLFPDVTPLAFRTYVLCDVFEVPERKLQLDRLDEAGRSAVPGTPILYYKANPASKTINTGEYRDRIYNIRDNSPLVSLGKLADWRLPIPQRNEHWLNGPLRVRPNPYFTANEYYFYEYLRDPKVQTGDLPWPYRPDTYLLISAGRDGLYGTPDDIRNFGRR